VLETGLDDDGDDRLDDAEVDSTQVLCNGSGLAVRSTPLPMGSSECPIGGVLVEMGIDRNGNARLDAAEVQSAEPICGASAVLLETRQLTADDGCHNGGIRVSSGHDDGEPGGVAGDGQLQPEEVEDNEDLCQDDVLVSGGSGSCSFVSRRGGAGSAGSIVLALALLLLRRRRQRRTEASV
jgi:hypothetical protein